MSWSASGVYLPLLKKMARLQLFSFLLLERCDFFMNALLLRLVDNATSALQSKGCKSLCQERATLWRG